MSDTTACVIQRKVVEKLKFTTFVQRGVFTMCVCEYVYVLCFLCTYVLFTWDTWEHSQAPH